MKKYFLSLTLFLCAAISYAQWQPDVRLTNDTGESRTIASNAWSIASSGSIVHVVWYDTRFGGNYRIFYKRSTDSGVSWESDTQLTFDTPFSTSPSIAVAGSTVQIVWDDIRDGNNEIYYKRSTDSGLSWNTDTRLTDNTASSVFPAVAVSESVVHVVWHGANIQYMRSTDSGVSWEQVVQLSNSPLAAVGASIAASGSDVHVVWMDNRDGNWEIYYKRSTDRGVIWGTDIRLTNNTFYSGYCSAAVSDSVVHVVWINGNEINYKRSTDSGVNWGTDIQLVSAYSAEPSIAVSGSVVHVEWTDWRDGAEIYYKRSTDSGVSWEPDTRLTNSTGNSLYPSVAVSGSVVHMAWTDERDGNKEIYYKSNPMGNLTGIKNNNSEIPEGFKLHQNYPNPFNPSTKISWQSPVGSWQTLKVYGVLGNEVATLVDEYKPAGEYEVEFNSHSGEVRNLPSGVYFYQLTAGDFIQTKKMLMIK